MVGVVLAGLLVVSGFALERPAARADGAVSPRVAVAIERTRHARTQASVAIWDVDSGERVYAFQEDRVRRTASVMKLATSLGALLALGSEAELTTEFRAAGPVEGGVLAHDLVVVGGGDPGYSARFAGSTAAAFDAVAQALVDGGLRRIEGDLVLDTAPFPGPDRHADWEHRPGRLEWWRAPVAALLVNDSCLDVRAEPADAVGGAARLELDPANALVPVDNRIRTVARKADHRLVYGPRGSDPGLVATGGIWVRSGGIESSLACFDPPTLFGAELAAALARAGVEVAGRTVVRRATVKEWRDGDFRSPPVLLHRTGTPVADVVRVCNQRSQNLYAELLLRAVGRELLGEGSFESGARAVRRVLAFPDDDPSFTQIDGSGLSRGNRATVDAIGAVLLRAWDSGVRGAFLDSLARGGDPDGTLRKRFRGEQYEGRVLGKTGTLRDTSALAGFVRRSDDRVFAFVVLTEGVVAHGRALQDAVVEALVESAR